MSSLSSLLKPPRIDIPFKLFFSASVRAYMALKIVTAVVYLRLPLVSVVLEPNTDVEILPVSYRLFPLSFLSSSTFLRSAPSSSAMIVRVQS